MSYLCARADCAGTRVRVPRKHNCLVQVFLLDGTMSLRPAKALVAESSKFSLRTLFESRTTGEPAPMPPPLTLPAAMPAGGASAGTTAAPAVSPPLPPLSTLPKIATKDHNKFTFNGLVMPSSAQNATTTSGVGAGLPAAAIASATASGGIDAIASENLRLKATAHTLQEKVTQLTAHLATTSESVMRGNKALVAERAQFHAQYSSLQDKLKDTQAALTEAEAVPKEAIKNEKLLTSKLIELQAENDRLSAAADDSDLRGQLDEAIEKHLSLAAAHSLLLEKHQALTADHEQMTTMLSAAQAEIGAAQARAEALQVEAATADALVDTLDAKLADARATVPTDGCGCGGTDEADPQAIEQPKMTRTYGEWKTRGEDEEPKKEEKDDEEEEDKPKQPPNFKPSAEAVKRTLDQTFGESMGAASNGWTIAEREAEAETATIEDAPVATAAPCPMTLRCEALQQAADEALHMMDTCCEHDVENAKTHHAHCEAVAKRAWASLASGQPEAAIAVHLYTDPLHVDEQPFPLSAQIPMMALQKGANYEGGGLLHCEAPCGAAVAVEYPNTAEGRTNAFIEAVSRDMKVSMDGSQAAYASSAKTGTAVRV